MWLTNRTHLLLVGVLAMALGLLARQTVNSQSKSQPVDSGTKPWIVIKGATGDINGKLDRIIADFDTEAEASAYTNECNRTASLYTLYTYTRRANRDAPSPRERDSPATIGTPFVKLPVVDPGPYKVMDSPGDPLKKEHPSEDADLQQLRDARQSALAGINRLKAKKGPVDQRQLDAANGLIDAYNRRLKDFISRYGRDYGMREMSRLSNDQGSARPGKNPRVARELTYADLIGKWGYEFKNGRRSLEFEFAKDGSVTVFNYGRPFAKRVTIRGNRIRFVTNEGWTGKHGVSVELEYRNGVLTGTAVYHDKAFGKRSYSGAAVLKKFSKP